VLLQLAGPLIEAFDVLHQKSDFALNEIGLLSHPHSLEDGSDGCERRHQRGRRDDPDLGAECLFHQRREGGVEFGVDRFAGQEEQRRFGRFPGNDVFLGDIADMLPDGLGEFTARRGQGWFIARLS
jgi:hypothetical protein